MPKFSFGEIQMGTTPQAAGQEPLGDDTPFQIAVLGDFTGRANRGVRDHDLAGRRAILIDRDNYDEVLEKLGVKLNLKLAGENGPAMELSFRELDEFYPDYLFEELELFQELRKTRRRLENPNTFAEAAAEVRDWGGGAQQKQAAESAADAGDSEEPPAGVPMPDDLLGAVLDSAQQSQQQSPVLADWNAYIASVVQPYIVPGTDPDQPELIAKVDEATSEQMRRVLHHPDFQAIEAAWRGVYLLIRRLETDSNLKVYLYDISREELAADLAADDLQNTGIYKLLVDKTVGTSGAIPWAVLAGNYTFDATVDDVQLLGRIGNIAQAAGAPFVAGGTPKFVSCKAYHETPDPDDWTLELDADTQEAWQALRGSPQAKYLALTTPRMILRRPYGRESDELERFEFEEHAGGSLHHGYLWGSGAFAVALLLGQSYTQAGWSLRPGMLEEVDNLPLHVYREDDEPTSKSCAEAHLVERSWDYFRNAGLILLIGVKNRESIRLSAFRSLAASGDVIAGRWS